MLSDYLKDIDKVDIYAIIGFFIFFIFFIVVTVHTLRMNKKETDELGNIPLDDGVVETDSEFND